MNARLSTLPAAFLLAACSDPTSVIPVEAADPPGPQVLPDAEAAPIDGGVARDESVGAVLGEHLHDAAYAAEEPDVRTNGPGCLRYCSRMACALQ